MRTNFLLSRSGIILCLLVVCFCFNAVYVHAIQPADRTNDPVLMKNAQDSELLSELPLTQGFNMGYPLLDYNYGSENSFQNTAWQTFINRFGHGWRLMWDPRTGRPNLIEGQGIPFYPGKGNKLAPIATELTREILNSKITAFVKEQKELLRIDLKNFKLNADGSHIFDNGRYCVMQYDYYMNDVVVEGVRVFFRFNNGNLIQFGTLNLGDGIIQTIPGISQRQAEENVVNAFSSKESEVEQIFRSWLKVAPEIPAGQDTYSAYTGKDGEGLAYRLIWVVWFKNNTGDEEYEAWVDAQTGKIVYRRMITLFGHVRGNISIQPLDRQWKTFPYCTVDNNGTLNTSWWGYYAYTSSPSTTATATINGQYFTATDTCGSISLSTALSPGDLNFSSSAGTDCVTPGVGGAGNTYSTRSSFWHHNIIRALANYYLPGIAWLDTNVTINNNRTNYTCNAYWSPGSGTTNFMKSDVVCYNSGESGAVIHHEWGHGLDQNDGGPAKIPAGEYATGEAFGDTGAIVVTKDSCIAQDLDKSNPCYHCPTACHGVRYLAMRFDDDNNPGTPDVPVTPANITNNNGPNCDMWACPYTDYLGIMGYEGHCEAYIPGGATWDMVQSIVSAHGEEGWAWSARIWFESTPSLGSAFQITSGGTCNTSATINGCAASNWYTVLLGTDDDDGNLTNGTPNGGRIWTAFADHGIACGAAPANYNICTEPSTPTLYAAPSDSQVGLSWTPSTGATGYRIFVNAFGTSTTCNAGGWVPYVTLAGNYNYYLMSNMYNTYGYGFAVMAINGDDTCVSNMSNCVFATPTASPQVNLTGQKSTSWDYVLVPSDNTCDSTTCNRSATLHGATASTYINFKVRNNSSENAGAHVHKLYVDDAEELSFSRASHTANTVFEEMNYTLWHKGGRSMLKLSIDANNDLAESLETDNTWIAPFAVFSPYDLYTDADRSITRTAPPDRDPQGYNYYSVDGYQFSVIPSGAQYWGVMGLLPSGTANYDLRLHDDYVGSSAGFGSNLQWSQSGGAGQVEFVGVNRNVATAATWWVGVLQGTGTPSTDVYKIHEAVSGTTVPVPVTGRAGNIPAVGVTAVEEIYVDSTDLATTWRITVTPTGGDIGIALFGSTLPHFEISDATANVNANGTGIAEYFDYQFPATGYYGLVIYKPDTSQSANDINYIIDISIAPSNLRPYQDPGWTAPVVPRDSTGCTTANCLVTATLPGWSGSTYLNSICINDGPNNITTSFQNRYLLDDVTDFDITFSGLNAGSRGVHNNSNTGIIKGGRHTLGLFVDANGSYAENNETDNTYYQQFVWSPQALADNTPVTTTTPPDRNSAGYFWYNCDGYQFTITPSGGQYYWGIVGILPTTSTPNLDVRLHDDYTGSQAGYGANVIASNTNASGEVEIIGVNRNQSTVATWWAGVIQGTDTPADGNYAAHFDLSGTALAVPSTGSTGNIPVNGVAAVEEIYIDSTDVGTTFTFTVTPSGGDIGIALINQSAQYFRLADALPGTLVNANGSNVAETFNWIPTTAGYYGLLIYKPNYAYVSNSINYTIDITVALSNIRPYTLSGWTASIVPRNATGCTIASCMLTATLPGWSGTTYMNSNSTNDGPNTINAAILDRYLLDDVELSWINFTPPFAAGANHWNINHAMPPIKGGRHTLGFFADANNSYTENNELDNTVYTQYVWSPLVLATNVPSSTTPPPDRNSTGYFYYNCDGYEFSVVPSGGLHYWGAVGMLPSTNASNYNVRLHNDYTGSTAGFGTTLTTSASGSLGAVEIVGINRNVAVAATWWAGVIQASDTPYTSNYAMHKNDSAAFVSVPSTGTTGNIVANGVVAIEEIYFDSTDLGTTWTFTITPTGGDIAVALISNTVEYFQLADAIPGTWVNLGGANQAETFTFAPTVAGYYGLLIFKPDYSQLANSINYTLNITASGIAETPDGRIVPGTPLRVAKSGSSQLQLTWGHSCDNIPSVTHYAIYRGTIASLQTGTYNHTSLICDSGTDNTETVSAETSSYYYLIVPTNNIQEGGYGFNSSAGSRPASSSACYPQNRVACP